MPARRFPPPWSVEELDACFVVRDHGGKSSLIPFPVLAQMTRRWLEIVAASGALIFSVGLIAGLLRSNAELHHSNLGSRPDWTNPPFSPFETFMLSFPAGPFLTIGGGLLLVALGWALFRRFWN